jgi:AMMECR1 domain-containing protein
LKNFKTPKVEELKIEDSSLLETNWSVFVTIYKNWEIRWASWNIKEIKDNLTEELIENTITAISKDSRFKPIKLDEAKDLKIRIDKIVNRKILQDNEIIQIDPTKFWVLAIKKDYSTMAAILPNINPILLTWEDLIPILNTKFNVWKFEEKDYILYKIETSVVDNFVTK